MHVIISQYNGKTCKFYDYIWCEKLFLSGDPSPELHMGSVENPGCFDNLDNGTGLIGNYCFDFEMTDGLYSYQDNNSYSRRKKKRLSAEEKMSPHITGNWSTETTNPPVVFLAGKEGLGSVPLPTSPKELVALCEKSKFGDLKTQTTILDESVRKAYEIPREKLHMINETLVELDVIKNKISEKLYGGRKISFALNKLNVYTEGGHFNTHVDTPKDKMIGTLLIELPYEYTGGEFKLNKYKVETKNKWFAFYADSPHSILPVKSGCRASVTFYILLDENDPGEYIKNSLITPPLTKKIGDMLFDKLSEHSWSEIGILLSHHYSDFEGKNFVYKGADRLLMDYLKNPASHAKYDSPMKVETRDDGTSYTVQTKFSPQFSKLIPVIITQQDTNDGGISSSAAVYRFEERDIVATAAMMNGKEVEYEPLAFGKFTAEDTEFYSIGAMPTWESYGEDQEYIEHTGNECQEGYSTGQYFNMAVLIRNSIKYLFDGKECDSEDEDSSDEEKEVGPEELRRFAGDIFDISDKEKRGYVTLDVWTPLVKHIILDQEEQGETWNTISQSCEVDDKVVVMRESFVQWYVRWHTKHQEGYGIGICLFNLVDTDNIGFVTLDQWPSLCPESLKAYDTVETKQRETWDTISSYTINRDAYNWDAKFDGPRICRFSFAYWYARWTLEVEGYESEDADPLPLPLLDEMLIELEDKDEDEDEAKPPVDMSWAFDSDGLHRRARSL